MDSLKRVLKRIRDKEKVRNIGFLIVGESGCGKTSMVNRITEQLELEVKEYEYWNSKMVKGFISHVKESKQPDSLMQFFADFDPEENKKNKDIIFLDDAEYMFENRGLNELNKIVENELSNYKKGKPTVPFVVVVTEYNAEPFIKALKSFKKIDAKIKPNYDLLFLGAKITPKAKKVLVKRAAGNLNRLKMDITLLKMTKKEITVDMIKQLFGTNHIDVIRTEREFLQLCLNFKKISEFNNWGEQLLHYVQKYHKVRFNIMKRVIKTISLKDYQKAVDAYSEAEIMIEGNKKIDGINEVVLTVDDIPNLTTVELVAINSLLRPVMMLPRKRKLEPYKTVNKPVKSKLRTLKEKCGAKI